MFDTKLEVDRHVESCLKNVGTEVERNLKCLAFARLYFKVADYEHARRYVSAYLTVKPLSAEALSLLGKILEKQGKREAAIEAYRKSLDINPKQNQLVIKVCELLSSDEVTLDVMGARYYCEKAQSFDPRNPIIFTLKERLVAAESQDPNDVTKLLLTELATHPTDVRLRVKLLRHLLQSNQFREAYKHASDIEQKCLPVFLNSLPWYETVAEVLVREQRESTSALSWDFWMLLVSVLDKLTSLTLDEHTNLKNGADCTAVVFNLDQTLSTAIKNISNCGEQPLMQEFISHYRAQLCLHLMTLLFKQAKRNLIKFKDAVQMALPLLFAAYHTQPPELNCIWLEQSPDYRRRQLQRWHKEASYRCSQAGHILLTLSKDRKMSLIEKTMQSCSGLWREQVFKKVFVTRDQQAKLKSSYFVGCSNLADITVRLPEVNDVSAHDEVAELVYPDSLHHLVWICLNQKLSVFKCTVFNGLQYSVKNLNNCSAESLSVLDVEAFLYCTALSAQQQLEDLKQQVFYNHDKPNILPSAVTSQLGSTTQTKWYTAAFKIYRHDYGSDMSELRLILIRGLEAVRCVGNHGLDVKLLITLANTFAERAKTLSKHSEIESNEARAELYWKTALPLLEKLQKNQAINYTNSRMFDYKSKEMGLSEMGSYIEEGKLFIATLLMKRKEHEKALSTFEGLRSPYASFYQAQIYKAMADEQVNQNKENVTSEMRSQHIILLSKARDFLYLTLDRLRDPSMDRKHPLNQQLGNEIEKVERLLSRIDPDVYHRNECDGMSDENVSSTGSVDHLNSFLTGNSCYPNESMTPHLDRTLNLTRYRLETSARREARPSPERLDAQLRQIQASKDAAIGHILDQNRIMMESHRSLVDAISNLTTTVEEFKSHSFRDEIQNIKETVGNLVTTVNDNRNNFQDMKDLMQEMKKEIAELKKDPGRKTNQLSDEDLYVLDEEYSGDYGINSNVPGFNPNTLYPRLPSANTLSYPPAALYPGLYPMYPYTNLGLPQAGALPFGQEASIQDFRALNALSHGLSQANYPQANVVQPGLAQTKPSWDVGNVQAGLGQLGLLPGALPQTVPLSIPQPVFSRVAETSSMATASNVPLNKAAPVNVVITSSDPLPKTSSVQTTQVLSVTIPPQHLKGSKKQVHNYQIPLPAATAASLAATPTIVNQPSPVISTQGLLSNVAAPVYSAVDNKANKNVGLGLQIEKTLAQNFGSPDKNVSDISATSFEEHDPCPDFKPIVPLPDEVPVNTGEENEKTLFCERAKLFRFTDKEWKERGVGNIKILQHNDSGKVRILMRRDQVHKICANHFLTSEMVLTPMFNSSRAYVWAAHDYSDSEMVVEKFCVRFKTEEEALAFAAAFEAVRKNLSKSAARSATSTGVATGTLNTASQKPEAIKTPEAGTVLGGFKFTSTPTFKPKESTPPPKVTVEKKEPQKTSPFASFTFTAAKPTAEAEKRPFAAFTFGAKPAVTAATTSSPFTPTTGSLFGTPTSTSLFSTLATTNLFSTPTTSSTFSTPTGASKTSVFSPPSATVEFKPVEVPTSSTPQKCAAVASPKTPEEYEPTVDFKPLIPLPELVEVKTGEENAEILFESRAKLLRFDSKMKEWKERGVGIMKILKESVVRLVMRREQVHKVCCNHQLLKTMQFMRMPNNSKAVTWFAQDFSEGVLKSEMFAIRFKSEEQVEAYLKAITSAQELLDGNSSVKANAKVVIPEIKSGPAEVRSKEDKKVKSEPAAEKPKEQPKTWGDKFKPKLGSWECKVCYIVNDSKTHLCVACETPRPGVSPKKPESPAAQFSFGVTPSTAPESVFKAVQNPTVSTTASSWGDAYKPKKGSWECQQCLVRNDAEKLYCVSCESPKNETVAKKEATNKGVDLDTPGFKFNFGVPADKPATSSWGDAFKPKEGTWECQQCLVRNEPDKLYCISCEAPKDDTVPKKEVNKGVSLETPGVNFNFGIPSTATISTTTQAAFAFGTSTATVVATPSIQPFSFAVKSSEDAAPKSEESSHKDFVFGSPQKHAFEFTPRSPRRQSSGCQGEEESDSYVEDDDDHIYFKPVIPLPDKVEVKTGEEHEEVVYCHRAKLFRFVQGEWKERGLGDIKILHNTETGKLRVVMRREQILKICLNHALTPDVEYIPKDDKTWLFSAADFSESEINHWQFCLRFKNAEIALNFKAAVDEALKKAKTEGTKVTTDSDSEVEFISETQVTPEEEQEAVRLMLPPKFMSYRQLPDCTCATCQKDDELLAELLQKKSSMSIFGFGTPCKPTSVGSGAGSANFLFGTKNVSFGASPSTPSTTEAEKSESLKEILMKPPILAAVAKNEAEQKSRFSFAVAAQNLPPPTSIFGQSPAKPASDGNALFSTTSPSLVSTTAASTTTAGSAFDASKTAFGSNIFGAPATTATTFGASGGSIFGSGESKAWRSSENQSENIFSKPSTTLSSFASVAAKAEPEEPASQEKKEDDEDDLVLKCDSNLSFASLAANTSGTPAFKTSADDSQPFAFLGSGTPVFASLKKRTPKSDQKKKDKEESKKHSGDEAEGSEAEGATEGDYDPHFEPIVPLPDAVVVATGEEEETVTFNERAKLYRYDNQNKEWKERGVGQMKILHHPLNGTYRFLLRREQVHKAVLNMLVTPNIDLQPMNTSDKAWLWYGHNYSEDESAWEQLAIRFKSCELSQQFRQAVERCVAALKDQQDKKHLPSSVQNYDTASSQDAAAAEEETQEDYDDEDDRSVMFMKPCRLNEQTESGTWQEVGAGDLQLYYDSDIYGSRISVSDDTGLVLSNNIIGINTEMTVHEDHSCVWKAVEWSSSTLSWRTLKATFLDQTSAEELHFSYLESVQFAHESDLVDGILSENPDEED